MFLGFCVDICILPQFLTNIVHFWFVIVCQLGVQHDTRATIRACLPSSCNCGFSANLHPYRQAPPSGSNYSLTWKSWNSNSSLLKPEKREHLRVNCIANYIYLINNLISDQHSIISKSSTQQPPTWYNFLPFRNKNLILKYCLLSGYFGLIILNFG